MPLFANAQCERKEERVVVRVTGSIIVVVYIFIRWFPCTIECAQYCLCMNTVRTKENDRYFLTFCNLHAESSYFQKYVLRTETECVRRTI